jgi:hypothetical protein
VAPDAGGAWGYVRLVPREGVEPASGGAGGAYGDRRLAGVRLVDYSRPGFVVVYADEGFEPGGTLRLTLRPGVAGPRFEPERAAVGAGGTIEIRNETGLRQVISAPAEGVLRGLEPGATVSLAADSAGEHDFFVLSAPDVGAHVFVAPGPFAVASESGRFELTGLAPGSRRVVAWHPRFPATVHHVQLAPGEVRRLDIELGVDRPHEVGR